jgi:hypothetical protein
MQARVECQQPVLIMILPRKGAVSALLISWQTGGGIAGTAKADLSTSSSAGSG